MLEQKYIFVQVCMETLCPQYTGLSSFAGRHENPGGEGYSHTLPIRVCAAQRGRDFEAPDLERAIHFRGVF